VEPEKQPLLVNGSETTLVSRQRLGKHVPTTSDMHATVEVLLKLFLLGQCIGVIRKMIRDTESVLYGSL
jgi:hypothetical protein